MARLISQRTDRCNRRREVYIPLRPAWQLSVGSASTLNLVSSVVAHAFSPLPPPPPPTLLPPPPTPFVLPAQASLSSPLRPTVATVHLDTLATDSEAARRDNPLSALWGAFDVHDASSEIWCKLEEREVKAPAQQGDMELHHAHTLPPVRGRVGDCAITMEWPERDCRGDAEVSAAHTHTSRERHMMDPAGC